MLKINGHVRFIVSADLGQNFIFVKFVLKIIEGKYQWVTAVEGETESVQQKYLSKQPPAQSFYLGTYHPKKDKLRRWEKLHSRGIITKIGKFRTLVIDDIKYVVFRPLHPKDLDYARFRRYWAVQSENA